MQEQSARATRLMVIDLVGHIVGRNVDIEQPYFAIFDLGVAVAQVYLAGSNRLYLSAFEGNTRFVAV